MPTTIRRSSSSTRNGHGVHEGLRVVLCDRIDDVPVWRLGWIPELLAVVDGAAGDCLLHGVVATVARHNATDIASASTVTRIR